MSEPTPPEPPSGPTPGRASSHRAATSARQGALRLAAPLSAVAVVVIVILLLIWINGRPGDGSGSGVVTAATSHPSTSATPTPTPTVSPPPTASAVTPSSSPTHHSRPPKTKASSAPTATAFAPVEVLNNSRVTGLAHQVAAEIEGKGWTVSAVGNVGGVVAETTVYYPAGELPAARHLAGEFAAIHRVAPQPAGIRSSGLVLVVTRYWTD